MHASTIPTLAIARRWPRGQHGDRVEIALDGALERRAG